MGQVRKQQQGASSSAGVMHKERLVGAAVAAAVTSGVLPGVDVMGGGLSTDTTTLTATTEATAAHPSERGDEVLTDLISSEDAGIFHSANAGMKPPLYYSPGMFTAFSGIYQAALAVLEQTYIAPPLPQVTPAEAKKGEEGQAGGEETGNCCLR